jgi:hypothetical protein
MTRPLRRDLSIEAPYAAEWDFDAILAPAADCTFVDYYLFDAREIPYRALRKSLEASETLQVALLPLPRNQQGAKWLALCSSTNSAAYRCRAGADTPAFDWHYYFVAHYVGLRALIEVGARKIGVTNIDMARDFHAFQGRLQPVLQRR